MPFTLRSVVEKIRGFNAALVVVCTCALVLSPILFTDFLNDDIAFVRFSLKGDQPDLGQLFSKAEIYSGTYYRPAVSLSIMFDFVFWGWNATGFRSTTLALHLLNTLLVLLLARNLFSSDPPVFLSALFFGLHPIHETSLFWLPGRTDVLCAFFFLLSILAFLKYYRSRRTGLLILSVASASASFLSKEMAISLPFIIGVVAFTLSEQQGRSRIRTAIASMLPTFLAISVIIVLRIVVLDNNIFLDNNPVHSNTNPTQLVKNYASYIGLLFIPFGHYEIEQLLSSSPALFITLAGLLLVCLIVLLPRIRKGAPRLYVSSLFVLITLIPVSRLMMRWYLYIPSIAFCLAMASIHEWASQRARRVAVASSLGLVLIYATVLVTKSVGWTQNSRLAGDLIGDLRQSVDLVHDKTISFLVIPSRTGTIPLFQLGFPEMIHRELDTRTPVTIFSKVVLDEYPGTVQTTFDSSTGAWVVSIDNNGHFTLDNPSFISKGRTASVGLQFVEPEAEITILSLTFAGKPNALSIRPLVPTNKGSLVSFDGRQFVKLSGAEASP